LERAVKEDPSIELAHMDLGDIYLAQNRNSAALAQYLEASKLAPDDAAPHWRLSRLYRTLGETDKARNESILVSKLKVHMYKTFYDQVSDAGKARHEHELQAPGADQQAPGADHQAPEAPHQ
jgi:Tfp pilus assembly protein PilF